MTRARWFRARPVSYTTVEGVEQPISKYSGWPLYCFRMQHAHTANEHSVYGYLETHGEKLYAKTGALVGIRYVGSWKDIAAGMSRGDEYWSVYTVRNNLRRLVGKHSIQAWDPSADKAIIRKAGDGRGKTVWMLPTYLAVLERRRADPRIATDKRGNTYVIGKSRRLLTPAEFKAWQIDEKEVERLGIRASVPNAKPEDFLPGQHSAPAGPRSNSPPVPIPAAGTAATVPSSMNPGKRDPAPQLVRKAVHEFCKTDRKGLVNLVGVARSAARKVGVSIPDDQIAEYVVECGKAAGKKGVGNVNFFIQSVPRRIDDGWFERSQQVLKRQQADYQREREERIQALVECLTWNDGPQPIPEFIGTTLAEADQSELAEARLRRSAQEEEVGTEWAEIKARLRDAISAEAYANWLRGTRQVSLHGSVLVVMCQDAVTADWNAREYMDLIARAAPGMDVRFTHSQEASPKAASR